MRRATGFTLLETVVALAILALALMAIFDLNAGAVANHTYSKKLTVASLLARGKMTDLEQELFDQGFATDDAEKSGDFSEEGWSSFKWRARIIAPKADGVDPSQLVGAIFNLPLGGSGGGAGGLASMLGQAGGAGAGAAAAGAASALGPMAGLMQGQMTQMVNQLTQAVREVHLTVSWKEGTQVESLDLVTHVVSMGQGTDRNLAPSQAGGTGTGAGIGTGLPGQPNPNQSLIR